MRARRILVTALLLWTGGVYAASPQQDINARVARLEQLMENQTLVDMLMRMEELQREVQQLRGLVEEQAHTINTLQRTQREQYMDLDRRISGIEKAKDGLGAASSERVPADTEAAGDEDNREQLAYQKAFALLRDLRYEQAIKAFNQYLKQYPDGANAHVAQYWLGEAHYAKRNFKLAAPEYQRLIDKYPKSPKVPDAMFKLGSSHHELGKKAASVKVLETLVRNYPKAPEAQQARNLLQKIKRAR